MSDALRDRLKQTKPFSGPDQEAMLALLVASSAVRRALDAICSEHGILASQYNILRILDGGPAEGYPRCDIIDRMIDRGPDVTRLVDELEDKGLVVRERSQEDRRMMMHRITDAGRTLLHRVTADLGVVRDEFDDAFSDEELEEFAEFCTELVGRFD